MVPEKRKLMVVGAALAAAFALPGCAPAGYGTTGGGGAVEPAANNAAADPTADPEPTAAAKEKTAAKAAPKLTDKQITNELTAKTVKRMLPYT